MEYFPTDNTVDPVERLSEELKKDPLLGKTCGDRKKCTLSFYVGDADPSDPLCSPAFAKDQALAAFPDCLIISAGEDSLRDDTEAFGMRLAKCRSLCDNAADHRGYAWIYYKPDTWLGTGTGSSVQIFSRSI